MWAATIRVAPANPNRPRMEGAAIGCRNTVVVYGVPSWGCVAIARCCWSAELIGTPFDRTALCVTRWAAEKRQFLERAHAVGRPCTSDRAPTGIPHGTPTSGS